MGTSRLALYEIRVAFGWASALTILLLPGYALLGWMIWSSQERQPSPSEIEAVFERLLPLAAGLLGAHLMSIERDERFDEIRRSYPEVWWRLPLVRSVIAAALILCAAGVSALIFHLAYGDVALTENLVPALPPGLYLLGLALLINNISGNYWAAAAVITVYWFIDYNTLGQYTGELFLFQATMPQTNVDYDLNRWLLTGIAFALLFLNALYCGWRKHGNG